MVASGQNRPNIPHILYVEDDPSHARLTMLSLESLGIEHRIHHVADGKEALDYLLRRGPYADPDTSPRPALVLLDLRLPKIDGQEVLRQIRQEEDLRYLPVVILSTSSAHRDIAAAYAARANSYLVKPVDFDQFNKMLAGATHYWLETNTPLEQEQEPAQPKS